MIKCNLIRPYLRVIIISLCIYYYYILPSNAESPTSVIKKRIDIVANIIDNNISIQSIDETDLIWHDSDDIEDNTGHSIEDNTDTIQKTDDSIEHHERSEDSIQDTTIDNDHNDSISTSTVEIDAIKPPHSDSLRSIQDTIGMAYVETVDEGIDYDEEDDKRRDIHEISGEESQNQDARSLSPQDREEGNGVLDSQFNEATFEWEYEGSNARALKAIDMKPNNELNRMDSFEDLDRNTLLDRVTLLDRGTILDRSAVLERSTPLDRNAILERSIPLDRNAVLDRNAALDRSGALDRSTPLDRGVILDRNDPAVLSGPIKHIRRRPFLTAALAAAHAAASAFVESANIAENSSENSNEGGFDLDAINAQVEKVVHGLIDAFSAEEENNNAVEKQKYARQERRYPPLPNTLESSPIEMHKQENSGQHDEPIYTYIQESVGPENMRSYIENMIRQADQTINSK